MTRGHAGRLDISLSVDNVHQAAIMGRRLLAPFTSDPCVGANAGVCVWTGADYVASSLSARLPLL